MTGSFQSMSHSKWDCKYHVVFIPKRRRKGSGNRSRRGQLAISQKLCAVRKLAHGTQYIQTHSLGRVLRQLGLLGRNNRKRAWFWRRVRSLSQNRLIFVDEAGVNTAMTRRYGRAPHGERAHDHAPRNYDEQTSLISALGVSRGLLATMRVQDAVDTLCFDTYVRQVLSRHLRRGDVILLDNLGAHKANCLEQVAEDRGVQVLWLPAWSSVGGEDSNDAARRCAPEVTLLG